MLNYVDMKLGCGIFTRIKQKCFDLRVNFFQSHSSLKEKPISKALTAIEKAYIPEFDKSVSL